jgi:hypothetical protein
MEYIQTRTRHNYCFNCTPASAQPVRTYVKILLRLQLLDSARAGGDARDEYGSGEECCPGGGGGGGESCGGEPPCGHREEATVRRR